MVNGGLVANPNGEVYGVIIPVPVSVMEKAGTYRFVLHFYDDFADSYKNHRVKAALEVNTHAQGLTFTIFTDPTHPKEDKKGHPGHHKGTRESMEFYVIIKAKTSLPKGKKPPKEIRFWLKRKMGEEMEIKKPDLELKGFLIKEESKGEVTEYIYQTHRTLTERGVTDWIITKKKGRWIIQVAKPHTSNNHTSNNIVEFKINKREQIVIVAKSWDGAEEKERWHGPCWGFAAEVYNHVGISLPSNETQYDKTIEDKVSVKARLVFFWVSDSPAHVAIQTDIGNIIDINCSYYENGKIETHKNEFGKRIVKEHDLERLLNYYRKHEFKSTKELQELDGE
ncbi:MAG: C40 family peptidase [Aquificaceae bacterium]|nr:C40 family peptidase [Aquificaceae bacterium]